MSCVLGSVCDWEVVHERISADIDPPRQRITAVAVLAVIAHNTDPNIDPKSRKNQPNVAPQHRRLYLNCMPQIDIKSVEVEGQETKYWLRTLDASDRTPDPISLPDTNFLIRPPDVSNLRSLDAYDLAYNSRLDWLDQGELCIFIPDSIAISKKLTQTTNLPDADLEVLDQLNAPVIVTIHYVINEPRAGVEFIQPSDNSSRTSWSAVALTEFANASAWFPCRLSHWERCTFDIDITVPATYQVFCPGRFAQKTAANDSQTKHTFFYEVHEPVLARNLTFAVGEFVVVNDSALDGAVQVSHVLVSGSASRDDLLHTVSCTNEAFNVFATYLGHPYPLPSYTQIFIDRTMTSVQSFSNVTLLSADLLHSDVIIDQTWKTRQLIAEGIARSWITHLIQTRTVSDHWIIEALVGYLVAMFVESAFGRNERRLQRLQMMEAVVDSSFLPWAYPLSSERYGHPSEIHCPHFRWKSSLVMHMLADLIGEAPFRDIIRQLLEDTDVPGETSAMVVEAADGEPLSVQQSAADKGSSGSARGISTKRLLKLCRHRSALNLDDFCDRWIHGVRCPVLRVQAQFERKKSACKLRVEQVGVIMHGILKVYIYETDQQVYEHESRMDSHVESFVFSCHSKVRKNRKRFSAEIGEEGDEDDLSNGEEEILEGDDASDVEENTENKFGKKLKNDTPVRWVRIDPKFGWIRGLTIDQLPLWADLELRQSPDIIAQIEGSICLGRTLLKGVISAARGKEKDPLQTLMAFNGLKSCLENNEYFHQVRIVAAQQLALCSRPRKLSSTDRQLSVLIEFLKSRLYSAPDRQLVEPSDFSDFSEYLVIRGVIDALSTVRVPGYGSRSPFAAMDILIDLLKYNDSSQNYYSDAYYVGTLIEALSRVYTTDSEYCDRIQKEIFRFLDSEQLFPSYNRIVTCACLKAIANIQVSRLKKQKVETKNPMDSSVVVAPEFDPVEAASQADKTANGPEFQFDLLSYSGPPHPPNVQVVSVNAAARVAVYKPELAVAIAEVIDKQTSLSLKYRMVESWASVWTQVFIESQKASEPYSAFDAYDQVTSRPALDAIWRLLISQHAKDSEGFRYQMWNVYASAFGTATPKPLSSDCLLKDKEIIADKILAKLPNSARRAAAVARQKRTHEQQFSIKQKKRPAKKADEPKTATDLLSVPPSTFADDAAMEIL